ncbi:hypothetical protein C922_05705 [Plasmodium inui San Antonio 1]|uniref:Uncharacterized protein n=1 Tax=Plasmodium inui San Antonio 1 TaxID=1237626 RepID=W6ZSL8_9APIC|nr:hypothetical protein C922_05705 [Plasmodium inui San Antonio 1]EUD63912.1 hypothetical protein C922_05705 [Plasmodium inui San Antonio 1]
MKNLEKINPKTSYTGLIANAFSKYVSSRNNDTTGPFLDRSNKHLRQLFNHARIFHWFNQQLSKETEEKNRTEVNMKDDINSYVQRFDLVHDTELDEDFRNRIKKSYLTFDQRELFRKWHGRYMKKRLRELIAPVCSGILIM